MKLREGYKRIAIRVTERGVYVEHTLSERRNQWRAPARLWASFFFFYGHLLERKCRYCANGTQ